MKTLRPVALSWLTLFLLSCALVLPAAAQSEEENSSESAVTEEEVAEDSSQDEPAADAEPDASNEFGEGWQHIVLIPFKDIKAALQVDSQVLVDYAEYLRLKALEVQQQKVKALLQQAEYTTRIEGDTARITAELKFHVWGDEEVEFPLNTGDAALGQVSSEQGDVYLKSADEGGTRLVFPKAGDYTVTVEMMVRAQKGTDGKSFVLSIPISSVTIFDLTLNEGRQKIDVKPEAVPVATTSQEGETRFRSHLKPTNQIEVSWHPEAGSRPEMNLLTSVDQKQEITIEGEVVLTKAELTYEILRGEMDQLQLAIPLSHQLLDIEAPGTNLKDWKVTQEESRQVIDVSFLSPLESKVKLIVQTERPLEEGTLQLLGQSEDGALESIQALGTVRERGEIYLRAAGTLELTVVKQEGVTRFRQNQKGEDTTADLAFRFFRTDATLIVSAKQIEPRVLANLSHFSRVQEESIETRTQAIIQIEREGLFELQFHVPEGLTVQYANGTNVSEHRFDEEAGLLHVFFREKTEGQVILQIGTTQLFEEVSPDEEHFLLLVETTNMEKEEGTISLLSSSSIDIQVLEEELFGVLPNTYIDPRMMPQQADQKLSHSWRYKEPPVEIYFLVKPKPALVTATISTLVDVEEELIRIDSEIDYRIQHAGVESFVLEVPEAISKKVRITPIGASSHNFQQAVPKEDPQDGWQTWLVTAQQPVTGNFQLSVSYDLPLPGNGPTTDEGLRKYSFTPVQLIDVAAPDDVHEESPLPSSVRGEIQVKTARHLAVKGTAEGGNVENIDVREVELKSYGETTLAYRYFAEPVTLDIEIRKYDIQEVLQTVVNKAGIEIVLSSDATATYLCNYRVRSSERQRFAIELPAGARPVRVLVNGEETTLEKNDAEAEEGLESYFLNVSRITASDEDFFVTIHFLWELTDPPFNSAGGKLQLPLPAFDDQGSGALVQQTRVGIWVPQEYSLLGTPDRFNRSRLIPFTFTLFDVYTQPEQKVADWMRLPKTQLVEVPRTGNGFYYNSLEQVNRIEVTWWQHTFYTWVISITVALIGFVLLKTSWDNRITILLCAVLVIALCMLSYGDWVLFTLFAARYGLIFLAILWLFKTFQSMQHSYDKETVVAAEPVAEPVATSESEPDVTPPADRNETSDPDNPSES